MNFEDFRSKAKQIKGVLQPNFIVYVECPKEYVPGAEQEDIGINATLVTNSELKKANYFSYATTIKKVFSEKIILEFIISEPYLHKFYNKISGVDGAKIIEKEQ